MTVTKVEVQRMIDIAHRAMLILGTMESNRRFVAASIVMELAFVHTRVVPLDLNLLASAPDADLMHDVVGIHYHLDREGSMLVDAFLPRCAKVTVQ